jgi:RNA polymerase sigma-70 factor (ECF subfamily)
VAIGSPPAVEAGRPLVMNEESFKAFYDRYARPLWGYLARASGRPDLADDLVQETFYRLLRAEFRPESEDHGRRYLYTIGTNLLRDHFRRAKGSQRSLEETAVESRGGGESGVTLRFDLRRILRKLRPRDRQLLWLAHAEQFSHREIASILGLKEESIRLLVFRARKRMAAELRAEGIGPEVMR